jgi:hypothetical protein
MRQQARVNRMGPIASPACCAATTTSTLPCVPRPRLPGLGPPMKISSTSTMPLSRSRPGRTIARRNLCSKFHAVRSLPNPNTRCMPRALTPLFWLVTCQIAGPRCHRGLPTAPPTVTQAPCRDPMVRPPACWAAEPIRPPQASEIVLARGVIREPIAELQNHARVLLHDPPQQKLESWPRPMRLLLCILQTQLFSVSTAVGTCARAASCATGCANDLACLLWVKGCPPTQLLPYRSLVSSSLDSCHELVNWRTYAWCQHRTSEDLADADLRWCPADHQDRLPRPGNR